MSAFAFRRVSNSLRSTFSPASASVMANRSSGVPPWSACNSWRRVSIAPFAARMRSGSFLSSVSRTAGRQPCTIHPKHNRLSWFVPLRADEKRIVALAPSRMEVCDSLSGSLLDNTSVFARNRRPRGHGGRMGKVTTLFYSPFDGVKPVYYRSVSNTGSLAIERPRLKSHPRTTRVRSGYFPGVRCSRLDSRASP